MIRVALLGAGAMGRVHADVYRSIPGVTVTAVGGHDHAATRALAASLDARAYTSVEALLDEAECDVVDCCLPTGLHRAAVEGTAARGRHVVCEKPIALTLEDARAAIAAAQRAGVHLLVGQVVRFFPAYRRLAAALGEGQVGAPALCTLLRQGFYPRGQDDWYRDDERSGGIFVDLMIHDCDWALRQFGPAERVYARLVRRDGYDGHDGYDADDGRPFAQAMATVRHCGGVITGLTATWGHPGPFTTAVEVAGTGGLLRLSTDDARPVRLLTDAPNGADSKGGVALPSLDGGEDPYRTQLAHFMDVVAGRAAPLVRPEEALAALELALAARASARTGRPRHLDREDVR